MSLLSDSSQQFDFFFLFSNKPAQMIVYIQVWRACNCTNVQHEWLLTIGYAFSFAFVPHICTRNGNSFVKKSDLRQASRKTEENSGLLKEDKGFISATDDHKHDQRHRVQR